MVKTAKKVAKKATTSKAKPLVSLAEKPLSQRYENLAQYIEDQTGYKIEDPFALQLAVTIYSRFQKSDVNRNFREELAGEREEREAAREQRRQEREAKKAEREAARAARAAKKATPAKASKKAAAKKSAAKKSVAAPAATDEVGAKRAAKKATKKVAKKAARRPASTSAPF